MKINLCEHGFQNCPKCNREEQITTLQTELGEALGLLEDFTHFSGELEVGNYMAGVLNRCEAFLAKHAELVRR